jgi:hypothetical protein
VVCDLSDLRSPLPSARLQKSRNLLHSSLVTCDPSSNRNLQAFACDWLRRMTKVQNTLEIAQRRHYDPQMFKVQDHQKIILPKGYKRVCQGHTQINKANDFTNRARSVKAVNDLFDIIHVSEFGIIFKSIFNL